MDIDNLDVKPSHRQHLYHSSRQTYFESPHNQIVLHQFVPVHSVSEPQVPLNTSYLLIIQNWQNLDPSKHKLSEVCNSGPLSVAAMASPDTIIHHISRSETIINFHKTIHCALLCYYHKIIISFLLISDAPWPAQSSGTEEHSRVTSSGNIAGWENVVLKTSNNDLV